MNHLQSIRAEEGGKPPLIVLVGPTAVGKTALSLQLAHSLGCEIISGDSMQVYRGMDIGTAKLPLVEREDIPHHLLDIRNPDEPFSVADFQEACGEAIQAIHNRGNIPMIVGGTGLYVESVCYDYKFQEQGVNEAFRDEMNLLASEQGPQHLHDKLAAVDALSAAKLHPNDTRRVIRALEIYETTGIPLSESNGQSRQDEKTSPYRLAIIGLTMERSVLYSRIDKRVDEMLAQGLIGEVEELLAAGVSERAVSMQALGYKEIVAYLEGRISCDEAVRMLKQDTRRFAKRQLSWFRHMRDLTWVDVDEAAKNNGLFETTCAIIAGKFAPST